MTDEYKLEILNYITNNVETTNPDNDEIFLEQEECIRDDWNGFLPPYYNNFRFEGMVAGNELTTNLTVLYGGYLDSTNVSHGIIVLVDENFKPVKTIYNYSSGTGLRYIQYMKQAEDGTFYFVDSDSFSYSKRQESYTSQKRFVMVNNFTVPNLMSSDYEIILRTSYIFPNDYRNFYCKNMFKDPNSSHYIMFGAGVDAQTGYYYRLLKIFGLKVNVGSSNEWTKYADVSQMLFGSAIATFDNDSNVRFRCLTTPNNTSSRALTLYSKTYTGNVSTSSIGSFSYTPYIDDNSYKKQSVFLDYDNVYFVQNNQKWGVEGSPNAKYIGLYKYDISNDIMTTIYEKSLGSYVRCNIEAIYIDRCDTDIYIQYNNNMDDDNATADYYFQRLVNDTWNPILLATTKRFSYDRRTIYVKSNFNLLQIYLYATNPRAVTWFQYIIKEDYNSLNYNGISYIDYNSLISKKGRIYSNNKVVFARNLYNRTLNNNNAVSTIQIPNNYLNGMTLDLKTLLSETDFSICNDTNETSKNIYEMMYVNYINSINVIDEDTGTIYPDTATYINTNINTGTKTNYDNSFIGKVKINYGEDTITQLLTWTWNTDHYETAFTIDTTDIPISLEYMSYDETTTYITKPLDLEQNKYYTISQKLRIE